LTELKDLYQQASDRFGEHVAAVGDGQWHAPTPCTDWDVRVLVNHLVSENRWLPPLLAGKTIGDVGSTLDGDLLGDDPKAAWKDSVAETNHAVGEVPLDRTVHLSYGDVPAEHYIFEVTTDLAIHGWDLARAIGADESIPTDLVDALYEHYKPREDRLKASGLFGPKVEPPSGADRRTELLAVFGREA